MLRFHTLGRLELVRSGSGADEAVPAQTKRLALLAYLALAPPAGARRETLMALFWPEAAEDEGRRSLRQALYYLRQLTGDGVLVSRSDETVAVAEGRLWCDALAFEAALAAGRATEAVELYRGEFLAGGAASDISADFELWAGQVRRRLRQRAAQGLWAIADQETLAGHPVGALDAARRARELTPDDEPGARRLIGLLDKLGDRAGALQVHRELVERLAHEFAAEPSDETRALGDALRQPSVPAVRVRAPATQPLTTGADLADAPALLSNPPAPAPARTARVWPRAAFVAGVAVLAVSAYTAVRPFLRHGDPTLLASGRMRPRDRVLVADFHNRTRDTLLGGAVTEALRVDLSQSHVVRVMSAQQVQSALRRMDRAVGGALADSLVREVALREGATAYVTGDVAVLGARYSISAQLVSAESGEVLAAMRETAADSTHLLTALSRLSGAMRARIGESLGTIRAGVPLDQVTTPSLQALRLFSQSTRVLHAQADRAKGRALLEEAVALDSTFASALVRLGIEYGVIGEYGRAAEMQTRAFRHRDRLGERERAYTSAIYYTGVTHEYDRAIAAYLTLLELDPTDVRALNNLAYIYADLRDFARAEEFYTRAVRADSSIVVVWNGLQQVLINQGKLAEARRAIDRAHALFPGNLHVEYTETYLAVAHGDYAVAARHARLMAEGSPDDAIRRADGYKTLADLALLRGKVGEASRYRRTAMRAEEEGGYLGHYLLDGLALAAADVWVRKTPPSASAPAALLTRYPLDSIPPLDRPYVELAGVYSGMGHPERALALARDFAGRGLAAGRFGEAAHHHMLGAAALAAGRYGDAVLELRQAAAEEQCPTCALPELAQAYDLGGAGDSAVAVYERYLETPWMGRLEIDAVRLPPAYERLGELYEARHEPQRAAAMYRRMIALWQEADPELRPRVAAAERRLASLAVERK